MSYERKETDDDERPKRTTINLRSTQTDEYRVYENIRVHFREREFAGLRIS